VEGRLFSPSEWYSLHAASRSLDIIHSSKGKEGKTDDGLSLTAFSISAFSLPT
jgi:hypothetical protein